MRSTGEVMGIDTDFGPAFAKAQLGGDQRAAHQGHGVRVGRQPRQARHHLPGQAPGRPRLPHRGHRRAPQTCCGATAIEAEVVRKHAERGADGERSIVDLINAGEIDMVVNTPERAERARGPTATPSARRRPRWTSRSSPRCSSSRRRCRASRRGMHRRPRRHLAAGPRGAPSTSTACGGRRRERGRPGAGGELIATRRVGAYHHLTLVAPGVAELARPGQFVALAVGGRRRRNLLRRCFSIHKVSPSGTYGGTVDVVVAAARPGHAVAHRPARPRPGRRRRPARPAVPAAHGAGGLRARRRRLRQRAAVLAGRGAARARLPRRDGARRRHRGPALRRRRGPAQPPTASPSPPTTARSGSRGLGQRRAAATSSTAPAAGVVYGCGPMGMLASVTDVADGARRRGPGAVEESMACGVGVCMTCVMPVTGNDGVTRMVRSCVEGPVFRGDRVRWDAFGDGIVPGARRRPSARRRAGGH